MKLTYLLLLLIIPSTYAVNVGLFVEFPGRMEARCISIPDNANAKEVLDSSDLNIKYLYSGAFIDSISDYKCHDKLCWFFYHGSGSKLQYSSHGIQDFSFTTETPIIYLGYYEFGNDFQPINRPKEVNFYDVCKVGKYFISENKELDFEFFICLLQFNKSSDSFLNSFSFLFTQSFISSTAIG